MYRPDLARILADRAAELGARIHYGTTVTSFTQDDDGVDVTLSDGSTGRYDLLIGADGLHSDIRSSSASTSSPSARAWASGARSCRARRTSRRPTSTTAGPSTSPATPTSEEMMYAYLVEPAQDRHLSPGRASVMKELSQAYGGRGTRSASPSTTRHA